MGSCRSSLGSCAALIRASLAYGVAGDIDADQVRALYHVSVVMDLFSALFFAAFAATVAGASLRTGFLPRAWGWASVAVALAFVVVATAWGRSGFWSPTGGAVVILTVIWLAYLLVISVLHFRQVSRTVADGLSPE